MNYVKNEKGTSAFYLLWITGIVLAIFVIVINIAKVYIIKEQANTAVEQAAIAGTSVLIEKTKEAIDAFDSSPESLPQKEADVKTISEQIDEKKMEYLSQNYSDSEAYIRALNDILPSKLALYNELKMEFETRLRDSTSLIYDAAQQVISANHGNIDERTEIILSREKWRIEIKATTTFESISDNKFIAAFIKKIPQKGYGPSLVYLKEIM